MESLESTREPRVTMGYLATLTLIPGSPQTSRVHLSRRTLTMLIRVLRWRHTPLFIGFHSHWTRKWRVFLTNSKPELTNHRKAKPKHRSLSILNGKPLYERKDNSGNRRSILRQEIVIVHKLDLFFRLSD